MTSAQKIIKYIAVGFACLLAFSIISGIVAAGAGILTAVGVINSKNVETIDCGGYEKCLNLEISFADLYIKKGENFEVEADDNFEVTKTDEKMVVKDKKPGNWFYRDNRKVIVTVPEDMNFDAVGIGGKGGKIEIEKISANELTLSVGAGETIVKDIKISDKAKIDTGAGRFAVESGEINDANINLGVGETDIRAAITGDSKVNAGIGAVKLDLLLPESEYTIKVDRGIGEIKFNGNSMSDGSVIGSGKNKLDVDGGIGEINIKTATAKNVEQ